jgi:hypothetical protein
MGPTDRVALKKTIHGQLVARVMCLLQLTNALGLLDSTRKFLIATLTFFQITHFFVESLLHSIKQLKPFLPREITRLVLLSEFSD